VVLDGRGIIDCGAASATGRTDRNKEVHAMHRGSKLSATIAALVVACPVAACAVAPPAGPSVIALPSQGKSLTVFQQEDAQCRNYASATIGYLQPGQAGTQAVVGSAAIGTALGAAAGAAIGAAAGNAGAGAAIGGATGLLGGTAVGANNAGAGEYDLQQRYNVAYTQCMYSRGNTVLAPLVTGYAPYGYYPYASWPWESPLGLNLGGAFFFGHFHHFHRLHHFHHFH
jgi:hypothetical protein